MKAIPLGAFAILALSMAASRASAQVRTFPPLSSGAPAAALPVPSASPAQSDATAPPPTPQASPLTAPSLATELETGSPPQRATPTSEGGPGDSKPSAAGPGGLRVESPTLGTPVPSKSVEARRTPAAVGGPGDPAAAAAGPGGFRVIALNESSEIRFRALVQGDGRFWFKDTQRPQVNTFLIRRAQPWAEGRLPYGLTFILIPDFGGGTVVLQDAYLGIEVNDALKFRFGKFRPPFGLERLQPTSNLSFVEFGLPTLLTPNRDVGAMAYGDLLSRVVGYAAGIFNGVPDNASGDVASDNPKEFDGRVYLRPFELIPRHALGRLFVGVATTFTRVYGTPGAPLLPAYKTPGQATIFSYTAPAAASANSANVAVANGPHNRYGAYLYEAIGPFGILGEYYESDQEVGSAGKGNVRVHNQAYQAQATLLFFGADASYDYVHVRTPVDLEAGHFGALEVALRAGHLNIDSASFPKFASTSGSVRGATELAASLNWYWSDNAKLVVDYENTQFDAGASTPTEVSAGHREAENIFLLRAQVVY
jgi:phosphate-selective porin OprO/OprP